MSDASSDASFDASSLTNGLHGCRVWWAKILWVSHVDGEGYAAIQLMVKVGDANIRLTL